MKQIICVLQLKFEKNTAFLLKNALFPLPTRYDLRKSGEIAGVNFQHCIWGGGSDKTAEILYASGVCAKTTKGQICPKIFVHDR